MKKPNLPPTYSTEKPKTVDLNQIYIPVGTDKIYVGRGGDVARGGLVRAPMPDGVLGFQRDPLERLGWVQKQVKNFTPYLFQDPIRLALDENGEYVDIDGGGRALIAHILGHPTIEAYVLEGLSYEEMAEVFQESSRSRVPLSAVQVFHTFVAKGSLRHVSILNAIAPYYVVKKEGTNAISGVAALYAVYDYANGAPADLTLPNYPGVELLKRTAEMCHRAWGPVHDDDNKLIRSPHKVAGNVFVAMAMVLQAAPEKFNEMKFLRWLSDNSPHDIHEAAVFDVHVGALSAASARAPRAAAKMLALDKAAPMAMVMARAYNKGLRAPYERILAGDIHNTPLAEHYAKERRSNH